MESSIVHQTSLVKSKTDPDVNRFLPILTVERLLLCFLVILTTCAMAEYVVRLHGNKDDRDIAAAEKCFLTYSIADKSIWYSMPENNDEKIQKEVAVSVSTVEFPKPLAKRLEQLWARMLQRSRYPDVSNARSDGTTYEFGMCGMYGETWSPQERKSPLLFVELGQALVAYCKAAPSDRPSAEESIEKKAAQLTKYLNAHR